MTQHNPILTIAGPTAVGKSIVAINAAQKINGEIIGLDSRQIYKGMAIGTAQPDKEALKKIPHHLIAIKDPGESVSAGEYARLVQEKIRSIQSRGKAPIICGGSGLYLEALTKGIFEGSKSDLTIRKQLNEEYNQNPATLLKRLHTIDPDYAAKVHIQNQKRLVRALEIYETTGKTPSQQYQIQQQEQLNPPRYCIVLLSMKMNLLEEKIRARTRHMLNNGWITETEKLLKKYSVQEAHALDSIGYRQIIRYLGGQLSLPELEDEIVLRTRQYAKRQLTWFRNRTECIELDVAAFENFAAIAGEVIRLWRNNNI